MKKPLDQVKHFQTPSGSAIPTEAEENFMPSQSTNQASPSSTPENKPPENFFQLGMHVIDSLGRIKPLIIGMLLVGGAITFIWSQVPEPGKLTVINRILGADPPKTSGYYPSVEVDEADYIVDLREWTPVPTGGDANQSCKVTFDDYLSCRRVRIDASHLARRAATTGNVPTFTSQTHPVSYQKADDNRRGGPQMSRFNVLLDISKEIVNTPFQAHLRSVRFGGFRDTEAEWTAVPILQATRKFTVKVRFPPGKKGKDFRLSVSSHSDGKNYRQLDSGLGVFKVQQTEAVWKVEHPKIGYAYRIDWNW